MKHPDDYAKRESSRNRAYREAYASPEARAWADSLTPAERERADALGLLSPYIEPTPGEHSLDTLPCALEPREEDKRSSNEIPLPLRQRMNAATAHPVWRKEMKKNTKPRDCGRSSCVPVNLGSAGPACAALRAKAPVPLLHTNSA